MKKLNIDIDTLTGYVFMDNLSVMTAEMGLNSDHQCNMVSRHIEGDLLPSL